MHDHPWFLRLHSALLKQGIAQPYADRLLFELWSHYLDVREQQVMENNAVDCDGMEPSYTQLCERLGEPETLALQAVGVDRGTWASRHPVVAFILGAPAIAMLLVVASVITSALILIPLTEGKTLQSAPWLGTLMAILGPVQVMVPTALACWLLGRSVRRSFRASAWAVAGCLMIALLAATTFVQWTPAQSESNSNMLSIGLNLPFANTWYQAIIPLLCGGLFAMRGRIHRRMPPANITALPTNAAA